MADVMRFEWADRDDQAVMAKGCHYDYPTQCWRDGHDHAHYADDRSPLTFCGADWATCQGDDDGQA